MNFWKLISNADVVGDRRNKQFTHEKRFDTVQYPVIKIVCGHEIAESILLIRSRINRIMCQNVSNANVIDKLAKYQEFLDANDDFNKQLDNGFVHMENNLSTSASETVPTCDRCSEYSNIIQRYMSNPKFLEPSHDEKSTL